MARFFARVKNYKRIPLPEFEGGDYWIDVREELSIGEERKVFAGSIKGQTQLQDGDTRTEYDAERVSFGMVVGYLVDWNLTDDEGKTMDCTPESIRGLLPDAYHVIEKAVNAHVDEVKVKKPKPAPRPIAEPISFSAAG